MYKQKSIIFIYGPTGVGKSDYALLLNDSIPIEIVNCDVGQLYTPLSIGTAKPKLTNQPIPHHLFNVVSEPRDYTVVEYRKALLELCKNIWARNAQPVVVGGSGFYIKSFFFPPLADNMSVTTFEDFSEQTNQELWDRLQQLDPLRASSIHKNDRYRLERAITLLSLRSSVHTLQPVYQDPGVPCLLLCLTRPKEDLYNRINQRTQLMLEGGWVEEVARLDDQWKLFLKKKKLIGYDVLIEFLAGTIDRKKVEECITQKTRHYAKRQMTFWRMLQKQLTTHLEKPSRVQEFALTDKEDSIEIYKKIITHFVDDVERNTR